MCKNRTQATYGTIMPNRAYETNKYWRKTMLDNLRFAIRKRGKFLELPSNADHAVFTAEDGKDGVLFTDFAEAQKFADAFVGEVVSVKLEKKD